MTSGTSRWRDVRPLPSAGPSGISRTVAGSAPAVSASSGVCLATSAPSGRREDRTGWRGAVQTSVRTCRVFVAAAWYNFVQAFDRTPVRTKAAPAALRTESTEAIMTATAVHMGTAHMGTARMGTAGVRLTRRGRLAVVVSVLGLMVVGFSTTGHVPSQAASSAGLQHARTVTVQPGESLWAVAVRVAPQADPRLVVARIAEINHLDGAQVAAGQQIQVPTVR